MIVEAGLEDADQDGTDEGADHGAPAAGEGSPADDTGAHRVKDVVYAGVARVHAAVLDRVDDPDDAGQERAEHEAQIFTRRTGTPASAAPSRLPPVAMTRTPKRVRLSKKWMATAMRITQRISDHSQTPIT